VKTPNSSLRRDFLKRLAAGGAFSAAGAVPTFTALSSVAEAAAPGNTQTTEVAADYKAIVCVYLYGGQDHGNMLVPYQDNATGGTAEYDRYAASRRPAGAPQTEGGNDLAYKRTTLESNSAARIISSTDTPGLPPGFTTNVYGRKFALHPSYSEIAFLYKQANSKLAVIANVGPMIAPVNRHVWYEIQRTYGDSPLLPANLYSHDDQQKAWMSGQANVLNPDEGAGGRIASAMASLNGAAKVPIAVSVSGINTFMLTNDAAAQPYQVGSGYFGRVETTGTPPVARCNTDSSYINANPTKNYCLTGGPIAVSNGYSWQSLLQSTVIGRYSPAQGSANIYARQWTETMNLSVRTEAAIADALINNPLNEDTIKSFSEYRPSSNPGAAPINVVDGPDGYNELAAQLRMTAALIRASAGLGASGSQPIKRQIFFVGIGGFDSHGPEFWSELPAQNKKIDNAIDAFWQAMSKVKVQGSTSGTGQDQVTLFTMSDFGRSMSGNGGGSDHGWGGHHIVLGGAVKGGKIYGANHNVTAGEIPPDTEFPAQKSRYMSVDATAGAVPRCGVPPLWYEQGNTGPGAKAAGLNHSLDRGELLVTLSSDAYMATIARWFGVTTAQLPAIFPTLNTAHPGFTNLASGVGFMNV
jgi:uncharacterized protein (DUF1501 family)